VARLSANLPIADAELEAFVDGLVSQAMVRDHIPGVAVAVVQDGRVVLRKGYGVSSLSPAKPVDADTTLFRLGAVSELFTWIGVMKEVERGHMRLDGQVNQYLPQPLQAPDQGYQRQVLLKDLMTHTSGFENRALGRLFERTPARVRPLSKYLRQEKPRRVMGAGQRPEYTAYDAALAGAALAQVAGRPYEDLIEQEILKPLGMNHTSFREPYPADADLPAPMPKVLADDLSQGFKWAGDDFETGPFEYMSQIGPAQSGSASAGDMARFMTLMLAGGTLDGQAIYNSQTAGAFRTVAARSGPGVDGWTYGGLAYRMPGGFTGYGAQGETPTFNADLVVIPDLRLGVFVAANARGGAVLTDELPGLIVQRFYAAPQPAAPPPAQDLAPLRAAYAGTYLNERRRYGGLEQFIALIRSEAVVEVTPGGRLLVHASDGAGAWVPTDGSGQFREAGGWRAAAFEMKDGIAQRWLPPSGAQSFVRVGPLWQTRTLAIVAALALIAAAATLIGLLTRDRREFRQTPVQGRASAIQTSTAILWLVATGAFLTWGARAAADIGNLYFDWPGPWVVIASSCALVAALCSLGQTLLLPAIWRGGRRVDSWTAWRKLRFSLTTLIFLAFSLLLMLWGALEPWSA
jgi:CubicO group peptidase (beta-lactamase class C family)